MHLCARVNERLVRLSICATEARPIYHFFYSYHRNVVSVFLYLISTFMYVILFVRLVDLFALTWLLCYRVSLAHLGCRVLVGNLEHRYFLSSIHYN